MGHLIAPTCCMLALVGQLGPWGHWVVAPGAHTSPLWIHATTQVGPMKNQHYCEPWGKTPTQGVWGVLGYVASNLSSWTMNQRLATPI